MKFISDQAIQQGCQYIIPVKIKKGGTYITPSNSEDIRIQVEDTLKSYKANQITFNTSTNEWLFPLMQGESHLIPQYITHMQIGIKLVDSIHYSPTITLLVDESIIQEI